jgi:hypothetical protein
MTKEEYLAGVAQTKEHIQAGDVFQLVLSQRFERHTQADPFEIYRSVKQPACPQQLLTNATVCLPILQHRCSTLYHLQEGSKHDCLCGVCQLYCNTTVAFSTSKQYIG